MPPKATEPRLTALQVLIETTDPQRRTVKERVRDTYRECGSLTTAAEQLSQEIGCTVTYAILWKWMTRDWGWSIHIENTLIIPEEQEGAK